MATEQQRFGKYRLLRRIAAGGMGEVHLAKLSGPSGFEKLVVIKRLLEARRADAKYVEMFFSEARVAAQLTHSNIVQIYETGEVEGVPYIAMEYVHGKSLRKFIDVVGKTHEGPASPVLVARMVMQLCRGLHFAHEARHLAGAPMGLIHRDINPLNVLISYQGEVKVIDFGIAKSELALDKTQAGTIKGTVVYMSPEQSLGQKLDRRSDLFSAGICLYEALTGKNPFHKGSLGASLEAIRQANPPPIATVRPELAPFSKLMATVLAASPGQRPASCAAFADALEELIASGKLPRPTRTLSATMVHLFAKDIADEEVVLERTDLSNLDDLNQALQARGNGTNVLPPRPEEPFVAERAAAQPPADDAGEQDKTSANVQLVDVTRESRLAPPQMAAPMPAPTPGPSALHRPGFPPLPLADEPSRTEARRPAARLGRLTRTAVSGSAAMWRQLHPLQRLQKVLAVSPGQRFGRFGLPASVGAAVLVVAIALTVHRFGRPGADAEGRATPLVSPDAAALQGPGQPGSQQGAADGGPAHTGPVRELLADSDAGFVASLPSGGEGAADGVAPAVADDASKSGAPRPERRARRGPRWPSSRSARPVPETTIPGANLRLRADPPLAMRHNGELAQNPIGLHAEHGLIEFRSGPGAPGYVIQLRYDVEGADVSYTIDSTPWADVAGAGGLALGRTPLRIEHAGENTLLVLTNPHISGPQHLSLKLQVPTPPQK